MVAEYCIGGALFQGDDFLKVSIGAQVAGLGVEASFALGGTRDTCTAVKEEPCLTTGADILLTSQAIRSLAVSAEAIVSVEETHRTELAGLGVTDRTVIENTLLGAGKFVAVDAG